MPSLVSATCSEGAAGADNGTAVSVSPGINCGPAVANFVTSPVVIGAPPTCLPRAGEPAVIGAARHVVVPYPTPRTLDTIAGSRLVVPGGGAGYVFGHAHL